MIETLDSAGDWLVENRLFLVVITAVLLLLIVVRRAYDRVRRRRPVNLHPRLQAYAGRSEAEIEAERREAEKIIATSSTGAVAGYEIVQQIEAVFQDGHRTPQEAVWALKAAAGRMGANAVINLSQQRTAAGRCTAQGDAVRVRPRAAAGRHPEPGTPASPDR